MPRYKSYDYNQLMMVPVSLEEQLVPGTLEYAIHHVIEERLDLSVFDERYRNDETGRSAVGLLELQKISHFLIQVHARYTQQTLTRPRAHGSSDLKFVRRSLSQVVEPADTLGSEILQIHGSAQVRSGVEAAYGCKITEQFAKPG